MSFTVKNGSNNYNLEVLETIGDSVLKLITAFFLYHKFK